jgi:O-antigen/teichoic acid export membrane protein
VFRQVARGASAVAVPIIGGMGLSFVVSIALARWLGAAEFGTYSVAWSWVVVIGTASVFGLDNTLVSQLPISATNRAWGQVRGLLRWANAVTLLASVALVGLAFLARFLLVGGGQPLLPPLWLLAGLAVPLIGLLRVQQAALRSLHRAALGLVPDSILIPLFMLGFIAISVETGSLAPTAEHALLAQVLAASAALVIAAWLVFRATPDEARTAQPRYQHRAWLMTSGRMFMLGSLSALNGRIGILMLGAIATPEVVGPYAVALRGASFVSLALSVTVLAMAPTIARTYGAGQMTRLERLARQMSLVALIGGGPIAVALIVWGRSFLLLFGPGFEGAAAALAILVLGEVVNVAAGPVATLLVLTGHERDAVFGLAVGTALNGGLCLILIPHWGINGAAVAAAISLVVWNLILLRLVRSRLALAPSFLNGLVSGARRAHD